MKLLFCYKLFLSLCAHHHHLYNSTEEDIPISSGSLGNVPQKLEKLVIKTRYISDFSPFSRVKLKNFTLENGLTVRNIRSFYNKVFFFNFL
jgi:hypothetical protein